jgi:hypothetical protein
MFGERARPRLLTRRLLVVAAAAAIGAATAGSAAAAPRATTGWWTSTGSLAAIYGADVPEGGMLAQGGASGGAPVAYGAVRFATETGERATQLTLAVAPNSLSTGSGSLQLCPLADPSFEPMFGGPMEQAPKYNCDVSVTAAPANGAFTFDLATLPAASPFAVAVLATTSDRVVLAKPADDALTTAPADAAELPTSDPSFDDSTVGATSDPTPVDSTSQLDLAYSPSTPGFEPSPIVTTPFDAGAAPVASAVESEAPTLARVGQVAAQTAAGGDTIGASPLVVLLVLAVMAETTWLAVRRSATSDAASPA